MIIGLPTLFRAWLINAKNSAFVRIMMLLNPVIQIIYMLACITAQINQRSIIVAKSHKYFLHLEIFATCPKYIQFTAFPKNLFIRKHPWSRAYIMWKKKCINQQMDRTSNSAFNFCSNFIILMKCGLFEKCQENISILWVLEIRWRGMHFSRLEGIAC